MYFGLSTRSVNVPVRCVVRTREPEIIEISAFCIPIAKVELTAKKLRENPKVLSMVKTHKKAGLGFQKQ
jgi:glycyl-tRNA synthetase (class II)